MRWLFSAPLSVLLSLSAAGCTSLGGYQLIHENELRELKKPSKSPPSPVEQVMEYARAMAELKKVERADAAEPDAIARLREDLQRILQELHNMLKNLRDDLQRHDQKGRSSL